MPYVEPAGDQKAGWLHYQQPPSPWEAFMKEEGIPVHEAVGVYDSRELPRTPWARTGGLGTYIELSGNQNRFSMYVVEIPAGGALNPERHMYEERFIVLDGRGTTEIWTDSQPKPQMFEWQQWSVFSAPLNTWHRLVNASSRPAIVLAVSTAPVAINTYQDLDFVFNNPFEFKGRYQATDDYFKPGEDFDVHPVQGRARLRSNLIPDAAHTYLPLDNNRGPGYRWFSPSMAGNTVLEGFIAEYPTGRYSKAHHHESGAVLVCMEGKGYSFTWPVELGTRPWESGNGEMVKRQDYVPGGMISAAPGGGHWFHQHFAVSKQPFRVFNFTGGTRNLRLGVSAGEQIAGVGAEIKEGGRALPYHEEDPFIREYYQRRIEEEGAEFAMPLEVYEGPSNLKLGFD